LHLRPWRFAYWWTTLDLGSRRFSHGRSFEIRPPTWSIIRFRRISNASTLRSRHSPGLNPLLRSFDLSLLFGLTKGPRIRSAAAKRVT
jgi:hypothetical protein